MFVCLFKVYEEQTVNVDVVFDYMMDPGPMLSTRSTSNNRILLTIVGDDHRTLEPAHEFPHQGAFQKQTYNNSFTMKPGSYGVILSKYDPPYNIRMFTFKESSCTIKGSKPSKIDVYSNNFSQYLLLKNKNLISGCASATRWNSSIIWRSSTVSDFKKFLRAGILKNRFFTRKSANWSEQ